MTQWIIREVRVPGDGHFEEKISHALLTKADGYPERMFSAQRPYLDQLEMVLLYAHIGDTYVEESLDGRRTKVSQVVVEDPELGTVRISGMERMCLDCQGSGYTDDFADEARKETERLADALLAEMADE